MVAQVRKLLGMGLYTPAEAAMYARVPTSTITRWIHGSTGGQPAVRAQVPASDEKIVTFLDFIQSLAIRAIRTKRKVPLGKIRETVERADEQYGLEYPFARRHTTYLLGDDVLLDLPEFGLVQVTGKQVNQLAMKKVVEIYLEDLSYNPDSGYAERYTAFLWKDRRITMDPHLRFGEPIVASSRHTAQTLWEAYEAEGSFAAAAKAFGVHSDDVEAACRYYDYLQINPAA